MELIHAYAQQQQVILLLLISILSSCLPLCQACRGQKVDDGVEVADGEQEPKPKEKIYRIPQEQDFLYSYATVSGRFVLLRFDSSRYVILN